MAKCSEILRVLEKAGWYVKSQKGSHKKMIHKDFGYSIIFPDHGSKEMATGTMNNILKAAGLKK
ncbi:Predicted RNA binding protein YcfA, dsRBD-like fold, HicA-like mRNA interferase family [Reichenbachiella faecimaris]|uniref:Predicted RNA binding protein YcfA, dsRBD-like fold, HicA-like mRNA interferase family n=1 Tax=Reichenbachiella faecimaris TaxID=692418 RepID=A0A1W2GRT1_REIFA|nr:type II toxin-antitoxin system HicA family toxin [Reichenbachiella faecimaris]SMD38966.1 Predicted RNA binding protein YcfA, dsRBD-like fold, HicA-like mRNA interferase family [Reichenbachiella faecimaris]